MAVFDVEKATASIDEVNQYHMGRYISSNKTIWRILSFSIHERHPTIVHLTEHLENGPCVYFTTKNEGVRALSPPQTTVTAFSILRMNDMFAKTLHFSELSTYIRWNASAKKIQCRKQGEAIKGHPNLYSTNALGQLRAIYPNNSECYYLRLLLINVRRPTFFKELRIIHRQICDTYREAYKNLNLL